ncbi:MAG: 50S ribosomal protein L2 [Candidatus Woesearchaeota archaeon]|jgi:large subunit ribosomal protein L2|nr:50S ribosomal protein L2 [Candidatus Woesearchaeota archaeon]MDP6265544.1 50S ribosomal protein L2 [Candidatus Woesearchaeota archaeon]MDP6600166.1 50S ribosomal protein L2 [Candidatus Woesearchaeota archaeon]MDP7322785.1 50S ribosomal protein L2 [Candidatus Woesearchaeota archaeon]MDP7476029.1 50S ribosomal protein L2 [Candidatus Woesearchaeota archaeon]|tara:strand:+ start:4162 stop:4875 length:714 start_codon:yes stop_codon:yes gene_type:complete
MGKNLIQQARGKGGPRYRAPSFRYKGKSKYGNYERETLNGKIINLIHCQGHSAPLAQVEYTNGNVVLMQAPEGVRIGDKVETGVNVDIKKCNMLPLKSIPEGIDIYNIESFPGDGGKFVKSSGGSAKIITKMQNRVVVELPSAKRRDFLPDCRATIGIVAGSGRKEKPFLKAGKRYYAMKAKNKLWPQVSGSSMNSVDHPFGGSSSASKSGPTQASRNAPPGRKVGKIAPKKTGKKR